MKTKEKLRKVRAFLLDVRYYRNSWPTEDFDAKIERMLALTKRARRTTP